MESRVARALWLLAIGVALWSGLRRARAVPSASDFVVREMPPLPRLDPASAIQRFASSGATPMVHAATAVELDDGRLRAFWYAGSREGAKDVALHSALFDPNEGSWSAESVAVTRRETRDDLGRYIRKLGNPVAFLDRAGRLWLFYVSVSFGGWSGSAVNVKVSADGGASFGRARRLVSSPFLDVGTLVKGPAFEYEDGSIGLPVYTELVGKFGELLRVDPSGRVVDKTRLSWGRSSLQPVVVPLTERDAVAFLRSSGSSPRRVLSTTTDDGGRSFGPLVETPLPNPDAAVSAIRAGAEILLAFNDSERDRGNLTIARSGDGGASFDVVGVVPAPESATPGPPRFAYPWLVETSAGGVHLLYTWDRERIAHAWFRP
jgi:predicted neuraminidase